MLSNRRAQITLYIILGVALLVFMAIPWQSNQRLESDIKPSGKDDTVSVQAYIQECIQQSSAILMSDFASRGDLLTESSILDGLEERAVFEGMDDIPTQEKITSQLSDAMKFESVSCVERYRGPLKIRNQVPTVQTVISTQEVKFIVEMPVHVSNGATENVYTQFTAMVSYPIISYTEAARHAIVALTGNPPGINITSLNNLKYHYTINTLEDNTVSITLYDPLRDPVTSYSFGVDLA